MPIISVQVIEVGCSEPRPWLYEAELLSRRRDAMEAALCLEVDHE